LYREPLLGPTRAEILEYTSSMEEDKLIACEVLEVLEAHVEELKALNAIPGSSADRILDELRALKENPGELFHYKAEDVHEAIEIHLYSRLGAEAGYLALGRSRNDHVAAALRLKVARMLLLESLEMLRLRRILLSRALQYLEEPLPLYTHMRPAQVSTVAHYLLYIDELLATYLNLIPALIEVTLRSPQGSGPAAGVMTPLDRRRLASRLFGERLVYNTFYATTSRDFMLLALAFNVSLLTSLSRIAEDLVVLSSPQIGYFKLPEEHLATSSIMPHKRNPATLEIARAKAGELLGYFVSVVSILKGLTSGYNLDMQEANKHVLAALKDALDTLRILGDVLEKLEVNEEAVRRDLELYPLLLPDLAEVIALKTGKPFREVHREIASYVRSSRSPAEVYEALKSIYGVELDYVKAIGRPVLGSPNPASAREYVEGELESLKDLESRLSLYFHLLESSCIKQHLVIREASFSSGTSSVNM